MKNKLKNRINKWIDGSMRNNALNRWLIGIVYGDSYGFLSIVFLGMLFGATLYNIREVRYIGRNISTLVETTKPVNKSCVDQAYQEVSNQLYQEVSKLLDSNGDGVTTEEDWKRGYKLINVHYDEINPVELSYGNLNNISAHLHNLE